MFLSVFEKDVIKAIYYINMENYKGRYIYPYTKTINSFLAGKKSSPFYFNIYKNYPDVCGKYPFLQSYDLIECLDDLVKKQMIKEEITPSKKVSYFATELAFEKFFKN